MWGEKIAKTVENDIGQFRMGLFCSKNLYHYINEANDFWLALFMIIQSQSEEAIFYVCKVRWDQKENGAGKQSIQVTGVQSAICNAASRGTSCL